MVNLEWYRTFVAIYQQGNMTKAAQDISISQPNVSVHLASLEQYVGAKLFERMPRKMVPTEIGRQLYTQVIGSLENLTSVELLFTKKSLKKRSVIRLGTPAEFFYSKLADSRLSNLSSELHVTFDIAKTLTKLLIDGELDFIVASQKLSDNKYIVYEPVLTENFIVVGSKMLDLEEFNKYLKNEDYDSTESWLSEQDWFAYSPDLAFIRRFWLKNFNKRPVFIPKYVIPDLNTIIKSISEGSGISVVSDFLAKDFIDKGKIVTVWDGRTVANNTIYLAFDKRKASPQKIDEMKNLLEIE